MVEPGQKCSGFVLFGKGEETLNAALAEPREIFKHAILANAAGIVMVHNHTSGRCVPSSEDMEITKRIEKAEKLLGIPLMDYIIVGGRVF